MSTYIKGKYKRSIYHSEKGYIIGIFKLFETDNEELEQYINKTITFTGTFADLNEDDTYYFYGQLVEHPKYGLQFNVSEYEKVKPEDKEGIIEFLSSELFYSIGEKLATSVVDTLGLQALDKILEDKSCLYSVPKITNKKVDIIYDTLIKYEESHKTIVYLTEIGFNMQDSLSIYNHYKENTFLQVEDNIYKIVDDITEISFKKVDEINRKLKSNPLDENRIKACIFYMMKTLTYKNGDTYLYIDEIYDQVLNYLNFELDVESFNSYLLELKEEEKIIIKEEKYYLKDIYDSEIKIINKINLLLKLPVTKYKNIDETIEVIGNINNIQYDEIQINAIKTSLEHNITVITGGPGTGKTTIIKAIVSLYRELNHLSENDLINDIALLAPTGRASKRLSETTNLPATTIHRFLGWNKEINKFKIDEYNKDNSKLIIIDEVSMIDINLLDSLFQGLLDNIKIILVGDFNQLPSVGPGQILKDIIESETIEVVKLNLLYRQNKNSYIPELAKEINENNLQEKFYDTTEDFTFLECSYVNMIGVLTNLCQTLQEKKYDYKRVQIMAPMYATINGIDNLNKNLQEIFNKENPEKREIKYGDVIFRENDKILQLVNMPDDNVFNGDIGILKYIIYANTSKSGSDEIYVDYDGNIVKYLPKDFNKIKHGFVISIHKSQGSEFEIVILPILNMYGRMLYRKLIYTAVTRAKRKLIVVGEKEAFIKSVSNNNEYKRKTDLKNKLIIMNNL